MKTTVRTTLFQWQHSDQGYQVITWNSDERRSTTSNTKPICAPAVERFFVRLLKNSKEVVSVSGQNI
jgi:hypothetical protein